MAKQKIRLLFFLLILVFSVKVSAQDFRGQIEEINSLIDNRNLERALVLAEQLRHSDHDLMKGVGLEFMGSIYYQQGRDSLALHYFDLSQPLFDSHSVYVRKGIIYLNRNELDSALTNYHKAYDRKFEGIDSLTWADICQDLGIIYKEKVQYEESAKFLKEALEYDPENWKIDFELSDLTAKSNQFEASVGWAEQALLKPGGQNSSVYYMKASALSFLEKFEESLEIGYTLLNDSIVGYDANIMIGIIYERTGRLDSALFYSEQALALRPEELIPLNNVAYMLQRMGRYEEALVYLDRTIALNSEFPYPHNNKAYCLLKTGEISRAFDQLK